MRKRLFGGKGRLYRRTARALAELEEEISGGGRFPPDGYPVGADGAFIP